MRCNERPQRWEDRIVRALQNAKEYGVQVQISDFNGEMEAKDFLDWLDSLESYFDWKEVSEERKVKIVGAKLGAELRGPASTWWKHYQNDREVRGKGKIRRWDKMKEKLKAQFLPRDYEQSLYQKVVDLLDVTGQPHVSDDAVAYAENLKEIQDQVRQKLVEMNQRYKEASDGHRRYKEYQVGDLVMVFLRRERFPTGTYHKLKSKKIGPCKIIRKFGENAYEVELSHNLDISLIFNVAVLYSYHGDIELGTRSVEGELLDQIPNKTKEKGFERLGTSFVKLEAPRRSYSLVTAFRAESYGCQHWSNELSGLLVRSNARLPWRQGLAGQYRLGGRSGAFVLFLGFGKLVLGLVFGNSFVRILARLWLPRQCLLETETGARGARVL
ncbi:hypothetical protein HHK36_000771 [Tetracentron sinense]|uniref:Retrotransposon gag domain-containing protein n=1 Tax=Tetracentron sinense TaxID=13715 RepID=A0A835DR06_TETSI|nr:hypothetical protein HHK36_000771 [Tetracentron sinense]